MNTLRSAPLRSLILRIPRSYTKNSAFLHSTTTRFYKPLQSKMSTFSNTDTGSKPADPYTATQKDDASVKDKVEVLSKFTSERKFGMLTTRDEKTGKLVSRAMAIAAQETGGLDYLFVTNTESHKTDELKADPHVNISFIDNSGQWASISGNSSIETDRSLVKKHYTPSLKAWLGDLGDGKHDGSENDPRIGIIRVKTITATYAVTDKTWVSRVAEIAKGTVTGEIAAVNKIREVSEADVAKWRTAASSQV